MLAPRSPRAARTTMVVALVALGLSLAALTVVDARHLHPVRPLLLGLLAVVFVSTSTALVLFEQRHGPDGNRASRRPDPLPTPRRVVGPRPRRRLRA